MKVSSTTFTAVIAWPCCEHPNRFRISRKWWIIRWTGWVCPDCKDLVPAPSPKGSLERSDRVHNPLPKKDL